MNQRLSCIRRVHCLLNSICVGFLAIHWSGMRGFYCNMRILLITWGSNACLKVNGYAVNNRPKYDQNVNKFDESAPLPILIQYLYLILYICLLVVQSGSPQSHWKANGREEYFPAILSVDHPLSTSLYMIKFHPGWSWLFKIYCWGYLGTPKVV